MTRQRGLRAYIVGLGLVALAISGFMVLVLLHMPRQHVLDLAPTALIFIALVWVGGRLTVLISESSSHVMDTTAQIATLIVLPLPAAVLVISVGKLLSDVSLRVQGKTRSWRALVVNTSSATVTNLFSGAAFVQLGGSVFLWRHDATTLLALPSLAAMAVLYQTVDTGVVVGAITLSSEDHPGVVFTQIIKDAFMPELSLIFVGIVFGVLWHFSPVLSLLIIVPVFFSFRSFESVSRLRRETVEAVLRMADSIDYRDTNTYEHSQRLADLTRRLAISIGLTPEHVDEIVLASRVHDLGKIGISNEILLKRGSLTVEERATMEEHPVIGANILSSYSAFRTSVEIVKHHHERWDGNGYPAKLRGEDIPVGSRIITVVDSYDSMTTDRPYRLGMSPDEAIDRLKAGIGSQFDPRICASFLQLLIEDGIYLPADSAPELRIVRPAAEYA